MTTPGSLSRLTEELERLPGVGRRTAERLAHHLLRVPEAEALALAEAIREARARVRACSLCRAPTETDPCTLCADAGRDPRLLVVVETARDLAALEAGGACRGRYYVLGGRLSPLEGVRAGDLDLGALRRRTATGGVTEVCLATNPDLEGDGTALAVVRALEDLPVRVTRLARGLPTGGQIEHQGAPVLADAFEERRTVRSAPADSRPPTGDDARAGTRPAPGAGGGMAVE